MPRILIIENDPRDVRFAEQGAMQSGFSSIIKTPSAEAAHARLEKARIDKEDLPDVILLDIDLGSESGFDFLRVRYMTPWLLRIPLVVWTKLANHNQSFCDVFKVQAYVQKSAGEYGLSKALENIMRQPSQDK
ncbi:MAG TPA: hypothetical protein VGF96_05935 [Terracidiphilus sp.]